MYETKSAGEVNEMVRLPTSPFSIVSVMLKASNERIPRRYDNGETLSNSL